MADSDRLKDLGKKLDKSLEERRGASPDNQEGSAAGLALRAVSELEAGLVYLNAPTIGSEIHLPFGGVKDTGNGHRESGTAAIEQFTEIKTVFLDFSGTLQRAHIDEPTSPD